MDEDQGQGPHIEDDDETPGAPLVVGEGIDPIAALLQIDVGVADITKVLQVPILHKGEGPAPKVPWTIRVLADSEITELRDQATKMVRAPGGKGPRVKELDGKKFNQLIVAAATTSPDLRSAQLKGHFGSCNPHVMLQKLVLPGTIDKLTDEVLTLGGYDDEELVAQGNG